METLYEIDNRKDALPVQVGRKVLYVRHRVSVVLGGHIQGAVISAGAESAVRLPHHVQGRRPGRGRPAHHAVLHEALENLFCGRKLVRREAAGAGVDRGTLRRDVMFDPMRHGWRVEPWGENLRKLVQYSLVTKVRVCGLCAKARDAGVQLVLVGAADGEGAVPVHEDAAAHVDGEIMLGEEIGDEPLMAKSLSCFCTAERSKTLMSLVLRS